MAANISVRELPSPEKVLTSLKSSGTFDRFRKSCMASIELDPVYLRHAEDLRQSGEDYLSKDSRASSTTKNEMRNELRGHIIKELSKSHVQKKLEDMITDVIKKREDEISGVISDAVQKLTKAEGSVESLNSNPSSSQVALPSHSPTKEAPKETALELLDAFGVSVSDVKKKGSKEAVASGKAKPPIPSEPRRVLSGGKHKGVAAQLSQVRPLPEAEPALDDKETGSSKFTSRRLHHLRLSSSDESGNGDGEESDSQPPLGEAQLQSSHASVKPSRERKELGLALQLQATKKLSRQKMESQHAPTVPPTTKPAMAESKDSPDNTHLPVGGSHHLSRHLLKRPFSSTEVTSKDGCSTQGQAKRQKCAHEDASGEECMAETEQVRFGDSSKRRAKDDTFMVTRSQLRKTQNN